MNVSGTQTTDRGKGRWVKNIYCDVPGSPCLSKNKANQVCNSCLVAARAVCWRPCLAGTQQYNFTEVITKITEVTGGWMNKNLAGMRPHTVRNRPNRTEKENEN